VVRRRAREDEVVVFPTPPLPVKKVNLGRVGEGRDDRVDSNVLEVVDEDEGFEYNFVDIRYSCLLY